MKTELQTIKDVFEISQARLKILRTKKQEFQSSLMDDEEKESFMAFTQDTPFDDEIETLSKVSRKTLDLINKIEFERDFPYALNPNYDPAVS